VEALLENIGADGAVNTPRPQTGVVSVAPLFREDHRKQPRGLRLAAVFRDFMRRAGLFVKHLAGGVRLFLALFRNLCDNGALENVDEHEAGVAMRRADASRCVVDVVDRHFPIIQRQIRVSALGMPCRDSVAEEVDGAGIGHRVVVPVAVRTPGAAVFGARAHGQRAISTERDAATELVECFSVRALHV